MTHPITRRAVLAGGAALGVTAALPLSAGASNHRQLASLNHSYTVFDQQTADAVADNAYLKRFGAFQLRTTTNGDQTYSGRYLLGRRTYLEMFAAGDLPAPDDRRGATGLALSPDRAGTIETIKQRMIDLGATPLDAVQTKLIDGEQIPWFRVVAPSTGYVAAFPWVMEYLESYFANPDTHSEPATFAHDVSRERYNPDTYRDRLMRDVVAVEFGAVAADVPAITINLQAAGLRVVQRGDTLIGVGRAEVIIVRTVALEDIGWRRIVFALNRSCDRHVERVGGSTLTVGPGRQAVWTFG